MTAPAVTEWLETMRRFYSEHGAYGTNGLHYHGDWDVVLQHGQPYASVPWGVWRGRGYRRGKARECYSNALHLAMEHPELTYCEGQATTGLMVVPHAWCVTADGRVVDPTWRPGDHKLPVAEWQYLGIPFALPWVLAVLDRKGTYGVLDDVKLYEQPLPAAAFAPTKEGNDGQANTAA